MDLAQGHLAALQAFEKAQGLLTVNLGTGQGYSVLEMIEAFSKSCGRDVPYDIVARRPGDVAVCYADPSQAIEVLGWRAIRGIDAMCRDHWLWQEKNPNGYR